MRKIFYVIGVLMVFLGAAMLIPLCYDYCCRNADWKAFLYACILTLGLGSILIASFKEENTSPFNRKNGFILTVLSWVVMIFFAAIPLYLSHFSLSIIDALFEATSALTTTGAVNVIGVHTARSGALLWSCLLQWLGGIGIIVMTMTLFPFLKVGGMRLLQLESSERSEKIMPRLSQMTKALFSVYIFFTLMGVLSLWTAGMQLFDAVCYGFTAIATGGMSTKQQAMDYFGNKNIEIVLIILMVIGGTPFLLFAEAFKKSPRVFWADDQFRLYIKMIFFSSLIWTLWRTFCTDINFLACLRHSIFHVVSILTNTGFNFEDYTQWEGFPPVFFFFLMFIGGCSGSTTGGIKIFRLQMISIITSMQLRKARYPHAIIVAHYKGQVIDEETYLSLLGFFSLFIVSYVGISLGLSLTGLEFVTCLSGAAASLTNVGVGLGALLGPKGDFSALSDPAKCLLAFGMVLGRLEFVTIYALFSRNFWRA